MNGYLKALSLAALPVLGNYAGGWMSERLAISEKRLSLALHMAAGIVEESRWDVLGLVGGFALFVLVTSYFR